MIKQLIDIPANPSSDLPVELVFDVLTPRPHFIIKHKAEFRKATPTENELKDVMKLITDFLIEKPDYDSNTILSFHRGLWYKQKCPDFHAHLCVPRKSYCREVQRMISSNQWLSSKDYLNRLEQNLICSKVKYSEYQTKCLVMAYRCFNDPVSRYLPLSQFNTSKFTLVFLASSPRIGVIAKKETTELKVLYNFMENFYFSARKKLSAINPLYENFGAHLCLHVGGKKKKNVHVVERTDRVLFNTIERIKTERIVGYVQMEEQLYLRWLPEIFHRTWLHEFRNNQHFVRT
ncbi:unnamed protein product [Adineta ricciae]|uniref:Uncharacterized protein n=1 Tax=Adineta ricciae TaxID=249248 RepID=A0A816FI76_ADIRI|nr:unnamed protein product [Adineta ricciae]CAF1661866.1 unnamed protein product [Adineta ricciae]